MDFLILTETFATKDFTFHNFTCFHNYAKKTDRGRPSGGVTIAMSKKLKMTAIVFHKDDSLLECQRQPETLA